MFPNNYFANYFADPYFTSSLLNGGEGLMCLGTIAVIPAMVITFLDVIPAVGVNDMDAGSCKD